MENNKHFWIEFIEMYRQQSCLWNVTGNDYSNKNKRNASYEILLKKMKEMYPAATIELVKKKINNMRTAFRREFKKVQDSKGTGTGADDVYEPTLWYYDLLLFTSQSEGGRKGRAIDEDEDEVLESNNTIEADDGSEHDRIFTSPSPLYSLPDSESPETSVEVNRTTSTPLSSTTSSCLITGKNKKRRTPINNSEIEQKRRRLLDLAHNVLTSNANKDETENEYAIAGKRIGYQLQGVEERQRIIAEKLISDVMFYARMGKLTEDAIVYCSNPSTQKTGKTSSYQLPSYSLEFTNANRHPYMVQHSQNTSTTPQPYPYHTLQVQNQTLNNHSNTTSDIRNYSNNYKPNE